MAFYLNVIKKLYDRKLYCPALLCLIVHALSHTVKPVHNKTTYIQSFFKTLQCRLHIRLSSYYNIARHIFLLTSVAFHYKEVEQCSDVLLSRPIQPVAHSIVVKLLIRYAQRFVWNMLYYVFLKLSEILKLIFSLSFRTHILHVSRNVLAVSEYSFLTHTFHGRHNLLLVHSENVSEIVNTRLCLRILCL